MGGPVAVLIHQSEEAVGDPLQVPRVTLHAEARELRHGGLEYETAKSRYLARFPDAAATFELVDFQLFELRFHDGRYVEGFARTVDFATKDLRAMGPPERPRKDAEEPDERRLWRIPRE